MSSVADVRDVVCQIIADEADVDVSEVSDDMRIGTDLNIGTVVGNAEFLNMKERLEGELGVCIPDSRIPQMEDVPNVTVRNIVQLFEDLLQSEL